ncbi:MAG: 5-deoxy-glucuronate isomerase, partial [Limisphaerales bacterium]
MFENSIRRMPRPQDVSGMSTQQLRETFLVGNLFAPGEFRAHFTDLDRLVVGGVTPAAKPIELPNHKETGRAFFLERRELGAINIGGAGKIVADGKTFAVENQSCVYLPMGTKKVSFESADEKNPAKFYFLSCPAHAAHPASMMKPKDASPVPLGLQTAANKRT